MQARGMQINRIRCPRASEGLRTLTAESYQEAFRIAYAEPACPPLGAARGIAGEVVLDAVIGKDGTIRSLAVRSGNPLLAACALETVRHWAYRPLLLNGRPVEVETQIALRFGR